MGEVTKNFIEDKSNEDLVSSGVFDKINGNEKTLDQAKETAINKKVEESFQEFLKINGDKKTQENFNEWLDGDVTRILDRNKIEEIRKINNGIENSLKNLNFSIELSALQQLIQESDRENDAQKTTVHSGEKEQTNLEKKLNDNITIETLIRSKVSDEQLQQLFKSINETNFKERAFVIDCLNKGKREDIRKIQYLLIGKKDEYEIGKSGNKIGTLKKYGTDGLFGKETFDALKNYIEDQNNKIEPVPQEIDNNELQNSEVLDPGKDGSSGGVKTKVPDEQPDIEQPSTKQSDVEQPTVGESEEKQDNTSEDGEYPTVTSTTKKSVTNEGEDHDEQPEQSQDPGQGEENQSVGDGTADVQYKTSLTMSRENYERRNENARNERDAIKQLLGKGFLGIFSGKKTEDISVGQTGYKIKLRSEEYNNLNALYGVLNEFQEQNDENYTLIDYFDVIFNKYQSGQTSFDGKFNDLMSLNKKDDNGRYIQPKGFLVKKYEDLGNLYVLYRQGEGGQYFNKVMGVLENYFLRGGISIEDIKNGKSFTKIFEENNYGIAKGGVDLQNLNIEFDDGDDSKDRIRYNEKGEKEFITMLSDFNLDGRLDHNDRGYYMGLELDNLYKSINIDLQNSDLSEQIESGQYVWKNIVNFAIDYFENLGDTDTAGKLRVEKIDELNKVLKEKQGDEGYKTLKSLQTMLKDSPVPISFICKYGNKSQEMFLNEVMLDEKFDEMYDAAFSELVEQGVDPKLKLGLKPAIYASYINGGIGGGFGAAYDTKNIGTLSMSLGATHVPGSEDLQYGIVLGLDPKFLQGNIGSGKIKGGVDVGYSTQGFLALGNADFVSGITNKRQLKAMNADSVKRVNIGVSAGWLCKGLYASLKGGMNYDYIEGTINKYNELNSYLRESLAKIFDDEKFKTFFKDGKIDTSKGEEIKGFLREKLGEAGEKNEEVVNAAVENIYSGLMYFSAGLNFDEKDEKAFNIAKNRMIYQLSETYTNKYISEHINEKLDGKFKLTNRSVGPAVFFNGNIAESISKSIYYSTIGGLGFTKFGNTYMTETDQSKASYEARLSSGLGLDYLEGSVDENGHITKETIDYMNKKLSVAYPNPNMPELALQYIGSDVGGNNINEVKIPKDLCKYVNISVDPSMEDYIKSEDGYFVLPTNTTLSLLTYSRTDSTRFNLVIGNYKCEKNGKYLNINSECKGDPSKHTLESSEVKIMKQTTIESKMLERFGNMGDFPLNTCKKVEDGKVYFDLKEGISTGVPSDPIAVSSDGKELIIPENGVLLIDKNGEGYRFSFKGSIGKSLTIRYNNGKISESSESSFVVEDTKDMSDVFEQYRDINELFDGIEKQLSRLDDNQWGNYASFMDAASDAGADGVLDANDYGVAFEKLQGMLNKLTPNDLEDTKLSDLNEKIKNNGRDLSSHEKVMIVDRFKMLFSYHIDLTDGQNDGVDLVRTIARRGNVYETLKGYNGQCIPGIHGYRERILEQLENKTSLSKNVFPNLVGMTAFYRYNKYGKKITQGRGYSMTEMGKTTVLGGCYEELNDENLKNWFIENLDKSNIHKEILKKSLSEKLKGILEFDDLELSDDNLKQILQGKILDIGGKKCKIKIDYVFYLLGECANESVGVNIGNVEIGSGGGGGGQGGGEGNGGEVTIDADTDFEGKSGVYVGNMEAANRTVVQEVTQFGAGAAVGGESGPHQGTGHHPNPSPNQGTHGGSN